MTEECPSEVLEEKRSSGRLTFPSVIVVELEIAEIPRKRSKSGRRLSLNGAREMRWSLGWCQVSSVESQRIHRERESCRVCELQDIRQRRMEDSEEQR